MRRVLIVFALTAAPMLRADDTPAPMPTSSNSTTPAAAAAVDDATVTHQGYPAARYESLWTKSPFAVETPETAPDSPDYSLVGIATVEGVSYISLIEKGNSEHFLLSSDKPERGLTLTSVTPGKEGADTFATVLKDGAPLTLKLEEAPTGPVAPNMPGPGMQMPAPPVAQTQQIPMPGSGPSAMPGGPRPQIRIHRPPIHVPPRPNQGQDTPPAPPPPAPGTNSPIPASPR